MKSRGSLSAGDHLQHVVDRSMRRNFSLRNAVLQHAFHGRLVCQDPTDEPASVLLERIRTERVSSVAGQSSLHAASGARPCLGLGLERIPKLRSSAQPLKVRREILWQRRRCNVEGTIEPPSADDFWKWLALALLSSQQRYSENSPVGRLWDGC